MKDLGKGGQGKWRIWRNGGLEKWRTWVNGGPTEMENLGKWRRPRETEDLEKRVICGNVGSGEMEDLAKWRTWGNGGSWEMEDLGKWRT